MEWSGLDKEVWHVGHTRPTSFHGMGVILMQAGMSIKPLFRQIETEKRSDTSPDISHMFTQNDWYIPLLPLLEPELASGPSPFPLYLDKVAIPSAWDCYTNQFYSSLLPNRPLLPPTTADADAGQSTALFPPHRSHTSSFETNHSYADFATTLVKPRPTQGCATRIETHVYLDIDLPSKWNAIQLPLTKSVTSDDSSTMIKPLLLDITVRGATTFIGGEYEEMGKIDPLSLIDFHSPTNILASERGMVQVHFTFSCYSRHHRKEDEQYVYVAVAQ